MSDFLTKVVGQFWSKAVERTAEGAFNNLNTIKNFDPTFKALLEDFQLLSAIASDVKEQTENAELSRRMKPKREVKQWLEQVESIEEEVDELKTRVESEGFFARLEDGGNAKKLNEQVLKLVNQSKAFGELVIRAHPPLF